YTRAVEGTVGLNYRVAPIAADPSDPSAAFRGVSAARTPTLETDAGDPVRIHVLVPWSEQGHVFGIEGHSWPFEPARSGTQILSAQQLGGLEAVTLILVGGAGGPFALPGDYIYGDRRAPYLEAGLWGVLRVRPPCAGGDLRPLAARSCFP